MPLQRFRQTMLMLWHLSDAGTAPLSFPQYPHRTMHLANERFVPILHPILFFVYRAMKASWLIPVSSRRCSLRVRWWRRWRRPLCKAWTRSSVAPRLLHFLQLMEIATQLRLNSTRSPAGNPLNATTAWSRLHHQRAMQLLLFGTVFQT